MAFWLKVTAAFVILAGALVSLFGVDWRTGVELCLLLGGFLPTVIRHTPRLYLTLSRLRYYLTNAETTWELTTQFRGQFTSEQVEKFVHRVALEDDPGTTVLDSKSGRFLIRYKRLFTVELLLGPGYETIAGIKDPDSDGFATLDVTVFEQQVGYRRSKHILETILVPLLEQLKDEFSARSGSYSLRIRFDRGNPFFGLYLQQLRPELVREFAFEFQLSGAAKDYVRVSKERMTVVATTLEGLRRSAVAGLTFSAAVK